MESVESGTFSHDGYPYRHPDGDLVYGDGEKLVLRKDRTFTYIHNYHEIATESNQQTILLRNEDTTYSGTFTISKDGKSFDFQAISKLYNQEYHLRPENTYERTETNDKRNVASSTVTFLADGQLGITVPELEGDDMMKGAVPSWLKRDGEGHLRIA